MLDRPLAPFCSQLVSTRCACVRRREAKRSAAAQWRKIFEANYHRSLDHRSFYFKQVDKRHLGAKGMIQVGGAAARYPASSAIWIVGVDCHDAGWTLCSTTWLSGSIVSKQLQRLRRILDELSRFHALPFAGDPGRGREVAPVRRRAAGAQRGSALLAPSQPQPHLRLQQPSGALIS